MKPPISTTENPCDSAREEHPPGRRARLWFIGLLSIVLLAALAILHPRSLPSALGGLADDRTLFGIANCLNVVSNLPFFLVGAWGLYFLWQAGARQDGAFINPQEKWPYVFCFAGIALIALGSGYYHLAPDGARLAWDRLPMTLVFMALLAAAIVERVSIKAGLYLLAPLLLIGIASVVYWRWSVLQGAENLLPYAAVQYGSIAVIAGLALAFPSRYTRGTDILGVIAMYAAAKVAEVLDAGIYALGHIVSGHTLKHLIAAFAAGWLLRMLKLRAASG